MLTALAGLIWYAYDAGVRAGSEEAAPLLKLSGPIKVPPPKPGGVTVAHQEKTIFNPVQGSRKDREVEKILPPPEKPLSPMRAFPSVPKIPGLTGKPSRQKTIEPPKNRKQQTRLVRPPVTPKDKKAPTKLTPIDPSKQRKRKTKNKKSAQSSGTMEYLIQIGALATRKQAESEWLELRRKHRDLLGKLQLKVFRAVVRGKVYYRLQAGPIATRLKTKNICKTLKKRGQACIVARARG